MKKNYEIKCRIDDGLNADQIKKALGKYARSMEKQTDIYYKTDKGRLKLRIINGEEGSLILYNRAEKNNKRISKYTITRTKDFRELDFILRKHFKIIVTVIKEREIFIYKNIRVHIDKVKGLGRFLEIEIIYDDFSKAEIQMKNIIDVLNLNEKNLIKESYSDLIINRR